MRHLRKRLLLAGVAMCLLSATLGYLAVGPVYYYSDALTGLVIDAQTKTPVGNASVVATWILEDIVTGHDDRVLHVAETVTDSEGRFLIPPMPRKLRNPLFALTFNDPLITVYKHGYRPGAISNEHRYFHPIRYYRDGKLQGKGEIPEGLRETSGPTGFSRRANRVALWAGTPIELVRAENRDEEVEALTRYRYHVYAKEFATPHYWREWLRGYFKTGMDERIRVPEEARKLMLKGTQIDLQN